MYVVLKTDGCLKKKKRTGGDQALYTYEQLFYRYKYMRECINRYVRKYSPIDIYDK